MISSLNTNLWTFCKECECPCKQKQNITFLNSRILKSVEEYVHGTNLNSQHMKNYLVDHKLLMIKPNNYYLASWFSHQSDSGGGVCIYINLYLESNMIDLSQYCIEKVIEVCAAQINIGNHLIILLCIYRSLNGHFGEYVVRLDLILKQLYEPKAEFIILGEAQCKSFNRFKFCSATNITSAFL